MEAALPLPFLISVAVPPGLAKLEGLNREEVSILGVPFFEAKSQLLEKLSRFLGRHNHEFYAHMDVTAIESSDEVVGLLDHGTRRVFVSPENLSEYTEFGARVLPAVSKPDISAASEHGLLIKDFDPATVDIDQFAQEALAKKIKHLYLKPKAGVSVDQTIKIAQKANAIAILASTDLTTNKEDKDRTLLSDVFSAYWQSDRPDGLLPTVVTDEAGVALGLAYTSAESILEALRTQTGVYQSRKRGLWVKGLTSGDTQELVRVALDCDNDTLKFVVKQKGRFCHLEQFGCFGNMSGVVALEHTLKSRKESAPTGSYTARLFSDEKLLRAKIMEEAEELCDAKTPENVAFEAADLIYFALTKVIGAGLSLADVEANLDAKSLKVKRRTGNAKGKWAEKEGIKTETAPEPKPASAPVPAPADDRAARAQLLLQRNDVALRSAAIRHPVAEQQDLHQARGIRRARSIRLHAERRPPC
jgi:phosphoribosyl-ATP pyrophosphohydrolase/phosphoribosyl-AMP cyclohydrolase/histidinol dehydrogenase